MRRLTTISILLTAVLALVGVLGSCDQTGKRVLIRYKFKPDMRMKYRQVTRGIVMVREGVSEELIHHESAKRTLDLELYVRRVLEDSTAEIVDNRSHTSEIQNLLDTTGTDSAEVRSWVGSEVLRYMKPNGQLVDLEYTSDTMRGDLSYAKEYMKQGYPVYPDKPVGQGHEWTQTTAVVLPDGPIEAYTTYTVKSFVRERGYDCVVLEYDGVSHIPIPEFEKEDYRVISGVDHIRAKGHMYFAYREGIVVQVKERWVMDSDRKEVLDKVKEDSKYQPGDTVAIKLAIEYDVEYYLQDLETP